ncbi:MAG: FISUMP domain-containing protein [bacterium]
MRNNYKSLGFIIVMAIFIMASAATADPYVCGDVNGDQIANISDAVYLIQYIFSGGPAPDCGSGPSGIGTVTDFDGNLYYTVKIGDQWWMLGNLRVTHYRNGDPIPNVTDNTEWEGLSTGAYCNYDNDEGNVATYGRLYNWYAVIDSRGIAPEGWHIPSDDEWKQLEMHLGMSQAEADATGFRGTDEGGKSKEAGITHWQSPNTGATNESGFTALPGGYRLSNAYFFWMGSNAFHWSSTEHLSTYGWSRELGYDGSQIHRAFSDKHYGFSVRCVRD